MWLDGEGGGMPGYISSKLWELVIQKSIQKYKF